MEFFSLNFPAIAIDTETTGLNYPVDRPFGFSIATPLTSGYWDIRKQPEALEWLRNALSQFKGTIVMFNATFDCKMLAQVGIEVNPYQVDDVAIRACLIDEHLGPGQYSLDALAKRYLGRTKVKEIYEDLAAIFGGRATKNVQMPRLQKAPPEMVAPYAREDADLTLSLWEDQNDRIKRQGIQQIADFERRTFPYVLAQERAGVRVDLDLAEKSYNRLSVLVEREKQALYKLAGRVLNVNSSPQIKDYYQPKQAKDGTWWLHNGFQCGTTPKGNPSIDNEVLQALAAVDPVADKIIEIRSLIRTCDTFLGQHILGHAHGGRVYPNINQVASDEGGTKTGRFSYTDPALQQIPSRNKEVAAIVKACFLADEGHVWVDGDMNSFEVRVFAHLVAAYNQAIAQAYKDDPTIDFHQWVADLMGVPRNPRKDGGPNAKQLNLSMIFNSGNGAIARRLGYETTTEQFTAANGQLVTYQKAPPEAMRVIDAYHSRVQGVRILADRAKAKAESRGYITTYAGRRLRFPHGWKSYKASGILIQATAADLNKENWWIIDEALNGRGRLILNTHDSYSMSVEEDKVDGAWKDVKNAVERPILRVPLVLDKNGVGPNWWEALQG